MSRIATAIAVSALLACARAPARPTRAVLREPVTHISPSPDGERIAVACADGTVRIAEMPGLEVAAAAPQPFPPARILWAAGGFLTIVGAGSVATWEPGAEPRQVHLDAPAAGRALATALSPDGSLLAVGGFEDGSASLVETATGVRRGLLRGHRAPVSSVAWAASGERVATASADGTVRVWDPGTEHATEVLESETPGSPEIAWSAAGALAWWTRGGQSIQVRVPGMPGRRELRVAAPLIEVVFSPDGDMLAAATLASLHVWSTDGWRGMLAGGPDQAERMAWSAGGRLAYRHALTGAVVLDDPLSGDRMGIGSMSCHALAPSAASTPKAASASAPKAASASGPQAASAPPPEAAFAWMPDGKSLLVAHEGEVGGLVLCVPPIQRIIRP